MVKIDAFIDAAILWLQQNVPLYWLLAVVVLALFYIVFLRRQQKGIVSELLLKQNELSAKHSELTAEQQTLNITKATTEQRLATTESERQFLAEKVEKDNQLINQLKVQAAQQQTQLNAEHQKLHELKQQFEEQKNQLKTEFKVVSEEIIKQRQAQLAEQNKEGVGALLKPLKEQIEGFQQRVNQVHDAAVKGNTNLQAEIKNVMQMGIQMRDEASNLTTALKGDSQQRGAWGEAQLERTLQMSGLLENDHYQKQSSFVDDEGKRKYTDYLIKLPDEKCIIIDSKVSLNDYERAAIADADSQEVAMQAHVMAVRSHIKDLASKDYASLNGVHSPDFVLMFMPIEPAYIEAMKHDRELFAFGYERNVILVSHTTLVPILRTVANLWTLERSNKEARLIGEKASDIFNSVALVSSRLEGLGKTLNTASTHYNDTVKALTGKQGLQGKVERFAELSSKASKTMPELSDKQIDFDITKLKVEPIAKIDPPADPTTEE